MKKIMILLSVSVTFLALTFKNKDQKQKNIIFISIDDLRPELGCYGQNQIQHKVHLPKCHIVCCLLL